MDRILSLHDLTVSFPGRDSWVPVVRDVSFGLDRGEFLGLVGESGSGKSMTALSILRLLPPHGRIDTGTGRCSRALTFCSFQNLRCGRFGAAG